KEQEHNEHKEQENNSRSMSWSQGTGAQGARAQEAGAEAVVRAQGVGAEAVARSRSTMSRKPIAEGGSKEQELKQEHKE
ncbi:MAG: hypothetical protein ACRC4N_06900, partial [Gammaproteobacteria bacterium]